MRFATTETFGAVNIEPDVTMIGRTLFHWIDAMTASDSGAGCSRSMTVIQQG